MTSNNRVIELTNVVEEICGNVRSFFTSVLLNENNLENTSNVYFKVLIKNPKTNTTLLSLVNRFQSKEDTSIRLEITSKRWMSYKTSRVRRSIDNGFINFISENGVELRDTLDTYLKEEINMILKKLEEFNVDIMFCHGDSNFVVLENHSYILLK